MWMQHILTFSRNMLGFVLFCCLVEKVFCSSVLWPFGKYGLPMAKAGCPGANGFSWTPGYIYQDLEDTGDKKTVISPNAHLQASDALNDVQQFFCMKDSKTTANDTNRKPWPVGEYCIYQKGSSCPANMSSGSVLWDNENANGNNKNSNNGSFPAGVYNKDTKIYFCCQTKAGSYKKSIELPTDKPFYLIAYRPYCQEVLNTVHTKEYIVYDTEDDHNSNGKTFPYPFGAELLNPRISYCYYQAVSVLTSQATTKQNNTAPFSFTKTSTVRPPPTPDTETTSKETSANSSTSRRHISMTEPGRSTTAEAETRNEPEATGDVINAIIGLMISLIVIGGVVGGAVFYWHRKRHKNDRSHSDQDRLAVTYSTVEKAITPDMEPTRDGPNSYEEIKDRKNPLYSGGDGVNTYEEVKASENPLYNGSDDHNAANLRESNDPTYESMDDPLKWTIA